MGTQLLESVSKTKQTHLICREQVKLIIDKILCRAAQDNISVHLVITRFRNSGLMFDLRSQSHNLINKALKGLFTDTAPSDWFYVQDQSCGFLSLIAGQSKEQTIQEIHHLHETWRILLEKCGHTSPEELSLTWGIASFPDDAIDRVGLLRATEIAWYQAQLGQNGAIGHFHTSGEKEVRLSLHTMQWERLRAISEREGIEIEDIIQEAIDDWLSQSH